MTAPTEPTAALARAEEAERLAEKATPGPWDEPHLSCDGVKCNCTYVLCQGYMGAIATIHVDNGLRVSEGGNDDPPLVEAKANGTLIARSRTLLPALASDVRSLAAENKRMREALEQAATWLRSAERPSVWDIADYIRAALGEGERGCEHADNTREHSKGVDQDAGRNKYTPGRERGISRSMG